MVITDVVKRIMDTWAGDERISSYCLTAFSKLPVFQDAVDENDPPGEEDFPLVCIYDWHSEGGLTPALARYRFLVGIAVKDKGITKNAILRTKSYDGLYKAEFLRTLAEQSLLSAGLGKVSWEGGGEILHAFPVFASLSVVTVEMHHSRTRK